MMSSNTAVTFLVVASCHLLLLPREGSAAPRCSINPEVNPQGCLFGIETDWCHNEVCAKGPGESCGGYRDVDGKCGEGTFCQNVCKVCFGCSPYNNKCHSPPIHTC